MNKIVAMFPGQASQFVGMGKFWHEKHESVRQRFEEASEILGFDLAALCFNGPALELNKTENTQPALLVLSVAQFEVFQKEEGATLDYLAGHSIGELSALTASGVFRFEDAVRIARVRGEAMASCNEGGTASMSAVTHLSGEITESVIKELDPEEKRVQIANYNSPTQTVLSGTKEGLEAAAEQLKAMGAKVIPLNVSGPFHSRFMGEAGKALANVLAPITLGSMTLPVMCGEEGRLYTREDDIKAALVNQLTAPVRWTRVLSQLSAHGVKTWIEIGPGSVLKKLTLNTIPEANVFAYDKEEERESLQAELESIRQEKLNVPNLIGLCLGAAVATRNTNWDEAAYQKGVVEPYKEIQALHERIQQENRAPEKKEMDQALALLTTIFQTKGVPSEEQVIRFNRIVRLTGTEELFPEHLGVAGVGR